MSCHMATLMRCATQQQQLMLQQQQLSHCQHKVMACYMPPAADWHNQTSEKKESGPCKCLQLPDQASGTRISKCCNQPGS